MKRKEKGQKFSLEAKKLINGYLEEVQMTLVNGQASQDVIEEITEELREHILQAYWKETSSNFVKEVELQEILDVMGNPREVASEYLLDKHTTSEQTLSLSSKVVESFASIYRVRLEHFVVLLFLLPIIFAISSYIALIIYFNHLGDNWIFLLAISDFFLLVPLIGYFTWWKRSTDLSKWRYMTPRRIQFYLILNGLLLVLGGLILPFLRGSVRYRSYQGNTLIRDTFSLKGIYDYYGTWSTLEFWIKEYYVILANTVQFLLLIFLLLAAWKSSISWKTLDIRFNLLNVKLPTKNDDTGRIRIRTTNCSPMTFSQIRMEILEKSPDLGITIKPLMRSVFEPKDAVTWLIEFTPKIDGIITLGRVVLQLDEKMYVYSPKYHFYARGKIETPEKGVGSSSQVTESEYLGEYPAHVDLTVSCGICKQSFSPSDLVMFCYLCGSLFHQTHLQEWLKGHENCPNCKLVIKVSETEYTYSKLVHERLKRLKGESQRLKIILDDFKQPSQDTVRVTPEVQEKVH